MLFKQKPDDIQIKKSGSVNFFTNKPLLTLFRANSGQKSAVVNILLRFNNHQNNIKMR